VKIADVSVFPVRFETGRSYLGALPDGADQDRYFVRAPWRSWYSAAFESLLVAIRTDDGLEGWGEALAPVGPQVAAAAVERLLAPAPGLSLPARVLVCAAAAALVVVPAALVVMPI